MLATGPTRISSRFGFWCRSPTGGAGFPSVFGLWRRKSDPYAESDVACIHLMQDGRTAARPPTGSTQRQTPIRLVAESPLHEPAEAALADEQAFADDATAADEDGTDGTAHG